MSATFRGGRAVRWAPALICPLLCSCACSSQARPLPSPVCLQPPPLCSEPSENPALQRRAHSRMLTQPFDMYGREADVDVMLEAKGMEQALLFYR